MQNANRQNSSTDSLQVDNPISDGSGAAFVGNPQSSLGFLKESYGLSKRELEVLRWVVEAKSDAEIAAILEISHRTVNHHVGSILRKFGVENRVAASRIAWEAQLQNGTDP